MGMVFGRVWKDRICLLCSIWFSIINC